MTEPVMTPKVDRITGAAQTIDWEHSKVHQGDAFTAHYESEAPLPTNVGDETAIGFLTPAAARGRMHMLIDVRADDESVWELREGAEVNDDEGSLLATLNRFRGHANISEMESNNADPTQGSLTSYTVAQATAADLSGGVILHSETIAIAGGPPFGAVSNAASRGQREFILRPFTEYVIIVTSSTVNDTVHEISLNWYESVHADFAN